MDKTLSSGRKSRSPICYNDTVDAWYTLVIVFFMNCILGMNYTNFPVYYIHFSNAFNASKAVTGAIGSIQQGVCYILGEFWCIFCCILGEFWCIFFHFISWRHAKCTCTCLAGVFFSPLLTLHGCRVTSCIGSILVFVSYFLGALATEVWQLHVTYGVLAGL